MSMYAQVWQAGKILDDIDEDEFDDEWVEAIQYHLDNLKPGGQFTVIFGRSK